MGSPIYIAGATATGKSAIAVEVAREMGGEIISVDSMQVYRGMDIGTAKPTIEERQNVPHHLIDLVELDAKFNAAQFVQQAETAIEGIQQPILCGGTGLYFRALAEGLGTAPEGDKEVRRELEGMTTEELLKELEARDPETLAVIDRQNRRRVVRAVEVIRLTGKPFSTQRAEWTGEVPAKFFLVERTREDLRARIEVRVEAMFAAGLVAETQRLGRPLEANLVASQALGYRQVLENLAGKRGLEETVQLVKTQTWKFARRQMTWFGKLKGAIPFGIAPDEEPAETARRVLKHLS